MHFMIKLILLSTFRCILPQYTYDNGSAEEDYDIPGKGRNSIEELEPVRELVNKWFGSVQEAEAKLWNRINDQSAYIVGTCQLETAWVYVEAMNTLRSKTADISPGETTSVLEQFGKALNIELEETQQLHSKTDCTQLFHKLKTHRSGLDCGLKPEVVSQYFANIIPYSNCWKFSEDLWRDVQSANYASCSGIYNDLVHVAQIAKGGSTDGDMSSTPKEKTRITLMANLTRTISIPLQYSFLNRMSCPHQPETSDCIKILEIVKMAVCGPLTISSVTDIESLIKEGSETHPPSNEADISAMLEIMSQLTDVIQVLSEDVHETRISHRVAVDMLETYMNIVDNTLGDSTDQTWEEMNRSRARKHRQVILINTEKYVSAAMDVIVGTTKSFNSSIVESELMAVQLKRTSHNVSNDKVGFEFADAQIEAELYENQTGDPINVFAIHYKSWKELRQGNSEGLISNQSLNEEKLFVGKGGIVSLTAHLNKEKKSVPVSFKMKFGSKVETGEPSATVRYHRCLSCEYLNTDSGVWENNGCIVQGADENGVTCHCNHTTNFAAFMSPVEIKIDMTDAQYRAKQIISYIGSVVSVIGLAISLIVFIVVRPTVRNDRLKAHMNLAAALLVVHVIQLTAVFAVNNDAVCLATAVMTHFFLLSSFFWMLIEGIFLYLYVVQVFVHSKVQYLRWIFLMGWAIPGIIVLASAGYGIPYGMYIQRKETARFCAEGEILFPPLSSRTDSLYESCWLSTKSGMVWSFIAPALAIIFINCIILSKVIEVLVKVSGKSNTMQPFGSPSTSFSTDKAGGRKGASFSNKMRPRKEAENHSQQSHSCATTETAINSYGATSAETGAKLSQISSSRPVTISDSPNRFDARIPSQAYMYNRAPYRPQHVTESLAASASHCMSDVKTAVKGALVLLPILGIPWICGMWAGESYALMLIFIVINSTQGLAIFIVYCLMNGEVRRALSKMRAMQARHGYGRSRTSSTSSLRSLSSKLTTNRRKPSTAGPRSINK